MATATSRSVWTNYVLDPLERASTTFVQQFVNFLLAVGAGGLLATQNWAGAADTAAFAAVISLILSVATFKVPPLSSVWDLVLRVVRTFLSSTAATLVAGKATHSIVHADWQGAVAIAVPVAFTALLKGIAALGLQDTPGASLIPSSWRGDTVSST
jgi:hypothetical protein